MSKLIKHLSCLIFIILTFFQISYSQTSYGGIGIAFAIDTNSKFPYITEVVKGTPAEKMHLVTNDFIIKINGKSTFNYNKDKVISQIRGPIGTTCDITIWRNRVEYPLKFTRVEITESSQESTPKNLPFEKSIKDKLTLQLNEILINASKDWRANSYASNSVYDLVITKSDINGAPEIVHASYQFSNAFFSKLQNGWVDVFYSNNIPFLMRFWDAENDYKVPKIDRALSLNEQNSNRSARAKFLTDIEFQYSKNSKRKLDSVLLILKSYEIKFPIKNYLVDSKHLKNVSGIKKTSPTETDLENGIPEKSYYYSYDENIEGLKNTSNHVIVLKGIKKGNSRYGGFYYEDISIIIEPGQTIPKVKINSFFDEKRLEIDIPYYFR